MMTINNEENHKSRKASGNTLGLYLHIPFCIQKCKYCDFLSFEGCTNTAQNAYIRALKDEIQWYSKVYGNKYYVDSIFIGGGTPSLLEAELICSLMTSVKAGFRLTDDAEISMESNPKTLTKEKLIAYRNAGINRLSIGAQSLNEGLLRFLGRIHTKEDFLNNYELARRCGFENINIDFMFGIPGQSESVWMETLGQALALHPEHISFYSLQMEQDTPFYNMFQKGEFQPITDEEDRRMYHEAVRLLQKYGYQHYEISNASLPGKACRHNLKYWSMENYLGMGLGAHSFLEGSRFSNVTDFEQYLRIGLQQDSERSESNPPNQNPSNQNLTTGSPFLSWQHQNNRADNIAEYLFTGLRKTEGIQLEDFERRFGATIESCFPSSWDKLERFLEKGQLVMAEGNLRLSLEGIDISNQIFMEFI